MRDREAGVPGRRAALRALALAAAWVCLGGHAPYGQWGVYRRRFLLILTTKADPASFDLGRRVAAVLAERLPTSRARVSRAPHKARVASLMATHQMDLALMRPADAAALRAGAPPFADYGPVPLMTIAALGDHLLVCRADFAGRHAWLIAEALVALSDPRAAGPIPLHPGAAAFLAGAPRPEAAERERGGTHAPGHR